MEENRYARLSTTVLLGFAKVCRDNIQFGCDVDIAVINLGLIRVPLRERPLADLSCIFELERQNNHTLYHRSPLPVIEYAAWRRSVQLDWPLLEIEKRHEQFIQTVFREIILERKESNKDRVLVSCT